MTINLVGVLENGAPRGTGVPANPRRTVQIPTGSSVSVNLRVLYSGGGLVDLTGGSVVMSIKKRPLGPVLLKKTASLGPILGLAQFSLVPADTRDLVPGQYIYDIWLATGTTRNSILPASPLFLEPGLTVIP